jgi:magnesium-transporting ATPase (P-type)
MSVIIRDLETGKIEILTKGADSIIAARLRNEQDSFEKKNKLEITSDLLEKYASKGLRTLMLAKRTLDEELYNQWNKKYNVSEKIKYFLYKIKENKVFFFFKLINFPKSKKTKMI